MKLLLAVTVDFCLAQDLSLTVSGHAVEGFPADVPYDNLPEWFRWNLVKPRHCESTNLSRLLSTSGDVED